MKNYYWLAAGLALLLLIGLGTGCWSMKQKVSLLKTRVHLLQKALAPGSPRLAANNWAEAVKERNGAWQYALLSPSLQAKNLKKFEEVNWVTGTSSPWVDNYEVKRLNGEDEQKINYEIKFNWYTASGYFGSTIALIEVTSREEGNNRVWYISKTQHKDTDMGINTIASRI